MAAGPTAQATVDLAALTPPSSGRRPRYWDGLRVLGYGEITLVIGWPTERPVVAVKRLPVFRDGDVGAYAGLLERYVRAAGAALRGADRGPLAYLARRSACVPRAAAGAARAHPQPRPAHADEERGRGAARAGRRRTCPLHAMTRSGSTRRRRTGGSTATRLGLLRRLHADACAIDDGREQLDLSLFLSVYPWVARPLLARIAPGVMAQYHDPRTVLLDVASNLHKEGLDRWVPALLEAANRRSSRPMTERGAPLLPPGQAAVGADAATAARRPRLAAARAPPALPAPAAAALPLRPPKTTQGALPMTDDARPARHQLGGVRADRVVISLPIRRRPTRRVGMDLVQGRREGVRVWDLEGRDYINCAARAASSTSATTRRSPSRR